MIKYLSLCCVIKPIPYKLTHKRGFLSMNNMVNETNNPTVADIRPQSDQERYQNHGRCRNMGLVRTGDL